MATYKRINQLKQTYSIGDNDFLAVDIQNSSETQKIKKTDLLYDYVKDAPSDISTKNWTWARRNKSWYRIYPDEYIFEAPFDGKIYVRINGKWASVEGVNGDMLKSIYDTHGRLTDIFDYTDNAVGIQDNATESLLGAPIIRRGETIEKDFSIKSKLLSFLIDGETNQILYNSILPKSFENKSSLSGINSFNLIVSGKDLFKYKDVSLGSYFNKELTNTLYSLKPTKVNSGEKYTIKNGLENTFYRFVSTNRLNEPDGIFITSFMPIGADVIIPDNVDYIGIECRYGLNVDGSIVYQELEKPLNSYIINTIIPFNDQYNSYEITCNKTLYAIDNLVYDYIDLINKKEVHQIEKEEITYSDEWKVSKIGANYRNNTIPFELQKNEETYWNVSSTIYGDCDALNVKTMDSFAISDEESICFYGGKIYIRLSYDRLSLTPGLEDERYLAGLQGFLQENTFNVIYENFEEKIETSIEIETIQNFDSITNFNCFYSFSFNEETYYEKCFLEIKFDNVVNNLIRKAGDNVYGRLVFFGENNLVVNSILGSDGNGSIGGPLFLNNNNDEKVYVNGNNPILDLRDFSDRLNWEPKGKTIEDKEANDKRLVNAEYIHRDYAPLNSPNLTGIPTAPKAQQIGSNQIATGEFIEENYYNKTQTDDNYIHTIDGVARGALVLDEILPKDNSNKKLIPNIEFIENYYYDSDETNAKFATLDSLIFIGTPTTPTPDETLPSQIANVNFVNNKYSILKNEINYIPKYKYLTGISTNITDASGQWPEQSLIDEKIIPIITEKYPNPELWNAVTVAVILLPSDKKRDLLYYYTDGSLGIEAGWYYLYDLSTTINRANGDTAGIVESSKNGDITFIDGDPVVNHAAKADMDKKGNQIDLTYATKEDLTNLENNVGKSTVYLVKWEE